MDGDAEMAGKRVLILDDVISTGESLAAMEHLVRGNGRGMAEGGAARKDIIICKAPLLTARARPGLRALNRGVPPRGNPCPPLCPPGTSAPCHSELLLSS